MSGGPVLAFHHKLVYLVGDMRLLIIPLLALVLASCHGGNKSFTLVSGSENEPLEPILKEFARQQGYDVNFAYKGSVDIMLDLQADSTVADAVWPASGKQGSVEIAKESERGIVEIETLKKVNNDLIATIEETLKIQADGRARRQQAEGELVKIETDLKAKLISLKS